MGEILADNDKGVHAEARRESFVLFTDFGDQRLELPWDRLAEASALVARLDEHSPHPPADSVGAALRGVRDAARKCAEALQHGELPDKTAIARLVNEIERADVALPPLGLETTLRPGARG